MATAYTSSMFSPVSGNASQQFPAAVSMINYAQGLVAYAQGAIGSLASAAGGVLGVTITPEFPSGPAAPAVETALAPTFDVPIWSAPGLPSAFVEVLETGDLEVEAFDEAAPELDFGTAPAEFTEALPDAPGVTLAFDDPELDYTLPDAPNLLSISVSNFAGMDLPTFDADDPELVAIEPSLREYVPGAQYSSALLTALQTSLEERITSGGTGLSPDAEQALWDRGREREAKAYRDQVADLERMERLGYAFPPGVYLDARLRLATERDAQDRGHSREVMVKAAELELDNVKTALTTATQVEAQAMNYANSTEQRLFESCKYATEAGVQIYNAKVQAFAATTEVYRAKVQVYTARIQAETAKVDAYKALVQAEQAKADVNRALVDQYKVQSEIALSAIEVYKARLAGIQTKAEIEKTKVEVFGEQVKAYTARVNAYTAGVEGFRAKIQAEGTKQQVYTAQVQAFSARVDAAVKQIEARIEAYKGRIAAKTVEWDGYKATVQGEASRLQSLAAVNGAVAETYKATVQGQSSYNDTLTKQWQAALDQNQRVAEIGVSAAKANAELYITSRQIAVDAAKAGAATSAQLGAAALNAVNFSSSYSLSDSYANSSSKSQSDSFSDSISQGFQTSYIHTYSES